MRRVTPENEWEDEITIREEFGFELEVKGWLAVIIDIEDQNDASTEFELFGVASIHHLVSHGLITSDD